MFAVSSAFAPDIHAHTQKQKGGYRRRENRGVKRATDRMPTLPKHHFVQMKFMFGDTEACAGLRPMQFQRLTP